MSLRDIRYQEDYRSGYDDLVEDFFRPSLREAETYWRAVGYFSSSALESFGSPLGEFIKNGGQIRLVTSVELSEADLNAIEKGVPKGDVCAARLDQIIEEEFADGMGDGVARLTRLLELGRLEIRIAVPTTGTGIYHEKIGLFLNGDDYVAFTGSSNESRNAFENNRECIDVYPLWEIPGRAHRKRRHFEDLWDGRDKGTETYEFPDAAKQKLLRIANESRSGTTVLQTNSIWRHQDEALEVFLKAQRGVLNMATGTGKTRTALKIMRKLFQQGEITCAVITMDGNDLLNQWYGELLAFRRELPGAIRIYRDYEPNKEVQAFVLSPTNSVLIVSRAAGSVRDPLASVLRQLSRGVVSRTLLIHDEVHRLGSVGNRARLTGLSANIRYRLGLSATPEREYDQEGNTFVDDHIGPVLFTFGLDDAIRRGILAPFDYYPLLYDLTPDDRRRIQDVYRRQAACAAAGNPMSDEEVWIELAKVHKTSPAKIPVFATFIGDHQDLLQRCIIFVETQEYGERVLDVVHRYRPDFHTYFTGEQSATLRRFARGDLECLITCHRLSEGIDIRSLNTVVLFSSAKARLETIQRIGRCLRIDPTNPGKVANIVDFVRQQSDDGNAPGVDEDRADWLRGLSKIRAEEVSS